MPPIATADKRPKNAPATNCSAGTTVSATKTPAAVRAGETCAVATSGRRAVSVAAARGQTGSWRGTAALRSAFSVLPVDGLDKRFDVAVRVRVSVPGVESFGHTGRMVHHEGAGEAVVAVGLHRLPHIVLPLVDEHLLEVVGGAHDVPEVHVADPPG